MQIKRKSMMILLLVLLCASSIYPTVSNVTAQEEIEQPKELTVIHAEGWSGPSAHFNPITFWQAASYLFQLTYESLAYYDELTDQYKPWLAEEWGWIDDYTFEIRLRPEPHWWDGTPVTAEDVVFSLETHANPKYSGVLTATFEMIDSISAIDERTIRIVVKKGYERFLRIEFDILTKPIFQKARWSKLMEEYEDITEYPNTDFDEMVASGPYRPVATGAKMDRYVRVENWWGEEIGWHCAPKYDILIYAGSDAKSADLWRTGVLTVCQQCISEGFVDLVKSDPYKGCWDEEAETAARMLGGMNIGYNLIPNYKNPLFRERWLRLALAYAINYKHMGPSALASATPHSPSLIHPYTSGVDQYINYEVIEESFETEDWDGVPVIKYDPELAIKILSEHCNGSVEEGWTYNGKKLGGWTILAVSGWGDCMTQAEMAANYWKEIGIDAEPVFLSYSVWESRVKNFDYDWYCGFNSITPGSAAAVRQLTNLLTVSSKAGYSVWTTPVTFPDFFPEEYEQIKPLIDEMWHLPYGSEESIKLAKKIQEIYVPLLIFIPCFASSNWWRWTTTEWVNFHTKTHPYEHSLSGSGPELFLMLKHIQPRCIELVDFSISPTTVEAGKSATASVTLRNTGEYAHEYKVEITLGPPRMPPPDPIAWKIVTVPAGKTMTVTIPIEIDEPGTYMLTVDNWRVGDTENEPGDPISKNLTVTEALSSEEVMAQIDKAISLIEEVRSLAESAKASAEEAKTIALEAKAAAETATPTWMIGASTIIAIVISIIASYVIFRSRSQ